MHSLKNTFVAVVLLGVSYFVYNGITNPVAAPKSEEPGMGLDLELPEGDLTGSMGEMATIPPANGSASRNLDGLKAPPLHQPSQSFQSQPSHFNTQPKTNNDFAANPANKQESPAIPAFNSDNQFRVNTPVQQTPAAPDFNTQTPMGNVAQRDGGQNNAMNNGSGSRSGDFQLATHTGPIDNRNSFTSTAATIDAVWPEIDQLIREQKFRDALRSLSRFYEAQDVSGAQRAKMLEWLDALAGKVIYSSEHNLVPSAYVIKSNDTMQSIAQQWGVPAQLVYNVNQAKINNPLTLIPGNELKIIQGPFSATLDTASRTLTLFLGDMYAGRFQATSLAQLEPGNYRVSSKVANGGQLGSFQVELTNVTTGTRCSLHAAQGAQGSIGLNANDAEDLFGILSNGSTVVIR